MSLLKFRVVTAVLATISLITSIFVQTKAISIVIFVILCVFVLLLCFRFLPSILHSSEKTSRHAIAFVSIFSMLLLFVCVFFGILKMTGKILFTESFDVTLSGAVISSIIIILGTVSPLLTRNGHTGLRLPWTVADDDSWRVAHQILGVISLPLGVFYLSLVFLTEPYRFLLLTLITMGIWIGVPACVSFIVYRRKF